MNYIKGEAILLINFTLNQSLRYNSITILQENLLRLEHQGYCKKCESFKGIEVYEWIGEHSFVEKLPADCIGNFLLVFNQQVLSNLTNIKPNLTSLT